MQFVFAASTYTDRIFMAIQTNYYILFINDLLLKIFYAYNSLIGK